MDGSATAAAVRAFVAVGEHVSCSLAGEAALLHLGTGVYYTLNRTGARLWDALRTPRTVPELRQVLLDGWGTAPEQDLLRFLDRLRDAGLAREVAPA